MEHSVNSSVIGRLLEEVSWDGVNVRAYRDGGRGRGNVLTAEVLCPLSFLPRDRFLGEILRLAHGPGDVCARVAAEMEDADVTLLPDELVLRPHEIKVQLDAQFISPNCYVMVEAKRIRRSSFQAEQLAREYLALLTAAGEKLPVLFLILPGPPPLAVRGHGRMGIHEAVSLRLDDVLAKTGGEAGSFESLAARIPDVLAWVTWDEIRTLVGGGRDAFRGARAGLGRTVERLCDAVTTAIDWHS
ncbi:hypothetical protein E0H73_43010 [Kribbella pittospori]|uniref:Restriction endonuclease n=1 Tax=Kribbella pittospori TaxID=722689 RepID=A0A4R0JQ21_9ACTN|nr:hypothetical protein [Kribbella pittospori]TCC48054.1 hypothetical protein E0H73_43010 [Kribbella pittospori]